MIHNLVNLSIRFLGTLLQFALISLISWKFGIGEVGIFNTFLAKIILFSTFFSLGLSVYLFKNFRVDNSELTNSLFLVLVISFIFILINVFTSFTSIYVLISGSALTVIRLISDCLKSIGRKKLGFFLEFSAINMVFTVIVLAQNNFFSFEFIYSAISTVISFLIVLFTFRIFSLKLNQINYHKLLTIWNKKNEIIALYTVVLLNAFIASLPYLLMENNVFGINFSEEEIGLFSIGHRLFSIFGTISLAVSHLFVQELNESVKIEPILSKSRFYNSFLGFFVLLLLFFFKPSLSSVFNIKDTYVSIFQNIVLFTTLVRFSGNLFGCVDLALQIKFKPNFEIYSQIIAIIIFLISLGLIIHTRIDILYFSILFSLLFFEKNFFTALILRNFMKNNFTRAYD